MIPPIALLCAFCATAKREFMYAKGAIRICSSCTRQANTAYAKADPTTYTHEKEAHK